MHLDDVSLSDEPRSSGNMGAEQTCSPGQIFGQVEEDAAPSSDATLVELNDRLTPEAKAYRDLYVEVARQAHDLSLPFSGKICCAVHPEEMPEADRKKVQAACCENGCVDLGAHQPFLSTVVLKTYVFIHCYGLPLSEGRQNEANAVIQKQSTLADPTKSSGAAHRCVHCCANECADSVGSVEAAKTGGEGSCRTANSRVCEFCGPDVDEEQEDDEDDASEEDEAELCKDDELPELLGCEDDGWSDAEEGEDEATGQEGGVTNCCHVRADLQSPATTVADTSAMKVEKARGECAVEILSEVVKREERKGSRTREASKALRTSPVLLLDSMRENIKGGPVGDLAVFCVIYL